MILPDVFCDRQEPTEESVASRLRPVATNEESSHASTPNRNARQAAGSIGRAWNPHDPTTPRHSASDGDGHQAPGCGPAFAQGPETGRHGRSQHSLQDAATAQAAWIN